MDKGIPLSVPNFIGKESEYVMKALKEEWVSTSGSYINEFEIKVANYLNVQSAVACQSGTAAIHLALRLTGITVGDEVIVPTLTFIAAVNPVKYQGGYPIFMDCDNSLNMDIEKLDEFCKRECLLSKDGLINKKTKRAIKAIVVVHIFGNMANMEGIMEIAQKYRLKVIEDATEAFGTFYIKGKYKGKFAGTIGDFGAYSFNGNKIITTGGGGMLVAKDISLLKKASYLSTQAKNDPLYYIHDEIGYNYRMTNLQAALGIAQLEQIENFIKIKRENYDTYKNEIKKIEGLSLLDFNKNIRSNYWFYSLMIDKEKYGLNRDEILKKLYKEKIQTRPIWGLIHEQKPYYENQSYKIERAKYYIQRVLNIPCSTDLMKKDIMTIVDILNQNHKRGM
ncbi:LegC family aminotransferase [Inediibacterium massiliense]|uniref:LegC family aminotransferase n=1 Tax=Inediibacterium massiliense TaxID=1658111 RepID=UPI0006B5D02E|nr:LegC family aminotransferase [Inediibacterium massiliense]